MAANKKAKKISGEMFDLTASSFNNTFGCEHNKCVIQHGINFPLTKYIKELEMILANDPDDKSEKRIARLTFLKLCNQSQYVQIMFNYFCNYLNGGYELNKYYGLSGNDMNMLTSQYKNCMIITATGGNIIIIFAKLIMNIINKADSYTETQNNLLDANKKILTAMTYDEILFKDIKDGEDKIKLIKLILTTIKSFFKSDENKLIVEDISKSYYSDFDFKLSPNIHPILKDLNADRMSKSKKEDTMTANNFDTLKKDSSNLPKISNDIDDKGDQDDTELAKLNTIPDYPSNISRIIAQGSDRLAQSCSLTSKDQKTLTKTERVNFFIENIILLADPSHSPGFLLFRVKTVRILIDNDIKKGLVNNWRNYTTQEQAKDRLDCNKYSKIQDVMMKRGLYPQTVQKEYLDFVDKDGDCYNFLSYLLKQKEDIQSETRKNIYKIVNYILQSLEGKSMEISKAVNEEDAIIKYIQIITFYINIYIYLWENKKLSSAAAPAYDKLPKTIKGINITHTKVCRNFLSLDTILRENSGLIVALAGDILHYFLQSPFFNTEAILDSETERTDNVHLLPPSDIILVQTQKKVTESLQFIKDIYETIKYSDYGYPDGVRVTINAIETEDTEIQLFTDRFSKDKDDKRQIIMVRIPVKKLEIKA
jgi:hypothetical protein